MQDVDGDRGARQAEKLRERGRQVGACRQGVEFVGGGRRAVQFEAQVEPGCGVDEGVRFLVGGGGDGGGGGAFWGGGLGRVDGGR